MLTSVSVRKLDTNGISSVLFLKIKLFSIIKDSLTEFILSEI